MTDDSSALFLEVGGLRYEYLKLCMIMICMYDMIWYVLRYVIMQCTVYGRALII